MDTSNSSSTASSSSSSSTPTRAYPKGKGAYLGASARSYLAGMGAAAAPKAGSDDKDAKPTESQQSESRPTRAIAGQEGNKHPQPSQEEVKSVQRR